MSPIGVGQVHFATAIEVRRLLARDVIIGKEVAEDVDAIDEIDGVVRGWRRSVECVDRNR